MGMKRVENASLLILNDLLWTNFALEIFDLTGTEYIIYKKYLSDETKILQSSQQKHQYDLNYYVYKVTCHIT